MKFIVITGGQTGVDQAAWRVAREFGCPTFGWMPKGYLTEDGPAMALSVLYHARPTATADYVERTRRNVEAAGLVLWLGPVGSPGYKATRRCAWTTLPDGQRAAEFLEVTRLAAPPDQVTVATLAAHGRACFAGSRESRQPGIGLAAEAYLRLLFAALEAMAYDRPEVLR